MLKQRPLFLAAGIAIGLSLSGCSSSGGGGGGQHASGSSPSRPSPAPLEPGLVRVAVADSAFDVATITNAERVIDSLDVHTNTTDVSGVDEWHGNAVASTITGGSLGSARLDLLKVEDGQGDTFSNALDYAIGEAALRGARVINASFSRRLEASDPRLSFNGVSSGASFQRVVDANDGKGAVYVVSAGNSGGAIDTQGNAIYDRHPDLYRMMLIAVGTTEDGSIHPLSSYPGDDSRLQERTVGAEYANRQEEAQGTSISAARVSEYAAGIVAQWPHLTAREASQRLLDTARQDNELFQHNSCGETGTLNCGAYYLGQGEADVDAALAPEGELVVSQSQRISEGGESADSSFMQLSGAYGNAVAASGVLDNVAVFDALGRDYQLNLGLHAQPRTRRAIQLRDQMEQLSQASAYAKQTQSIEQGHYRFTSSNNSMGDVLSSRFDGTFGDVQLSAFSFAGDQPDPMSGYMESAMMPMISFQAGSELTQAFESVNGVKTRYPLGEQLSLTASHWVGGVNSMESHSDYRANRSDVGLALQVSPALSVSGYVGQLDEQQGLLGASGSGALGLGEQNQMAFAGIGLQAAFNNGFSGFAEFEQGRGSAVGSGLLTRIDDIKAQQMALGVQWSGSGQRADERAAFTLRQPLRIASANALFDVPVGRRLDGSVIRETRSASLEPSGRQLDIELGYAFPTSDRSLWQFNLLHTLEPGHDADAPSDSAAMVNYTYAW
ncbi:S8 family peptidase [Vreelandella alkaliphila]|uniref:S8 family serine peptidase n=1 Tax=Vreelandella alkaliphila TaxID=272774 RepID=A0A7C9P486_9GAMM|nr:S8 family serine peptidase [Halomonas alkaliphila]NDL71396.1 S8 family serine peptidase [Halomonas alkaliphila]